MVSEVLDFDGHAAVRSACARIHNSNRVAMCHISEVWRTVSHKQLMRDLA